MKHDVSESIIDFALVRAILERLQQVYPESDKEIWTMEPNPKKCIQHLQYMQESGLIQAGIQRGMPNPVTGEARYFVSDTRITTRGIDFLRPDGGVTALSGPVVRIAPDSLVALVDTVLAERQVPAEERGAVAKALSIAAPEAIKDVVHRLISLGITHAPDLLALLR